MMKKTMIALGTAAVIGSAALAPTTASAGGYHGHYHGYHKVYAPVKICKYKYKRVWSDYYYRYITKKVKFCFYKKRRVYY